MIWLMDYFNGTSSNHFVEIEIKERKSKASPCGNMSTTFGRFRDSLVALWLIYPVRKKYTYANVLCALLQDYSLYWTFTHVRSV